MPALVLWWRVFLLLCRVPCLLPALSPCVWLVACKYGSISHFKGVFSVVWGCCVGLCCLGALRGLCGFCTRVELGGLEACGVFASVFPLLCLPLSLFALPFILLCSGCLLLVLLPCLCSLCGLLFLFPLRTIRKERARRVGASSLVLLCVPAMRCICSPFRYPLHLEKALKLSSLLMFPIVSDGFCWSGLFVCHPFLNSPSHL